MKVTINEGYVGVLSERGIIKDILPAGRHRYSYTFRNQRVNQIDTRLTPQMASTAANSKDHVSISVFTYFAYRVVDAKKYSIAASDPTAFVVREVNDEVGRKVVDAEHADVEEYLTSKTDEVIAAVNEKVAAMGIRVESISRPTVTLPKNIRNAIDAQVAAKNKAIADLEEARGRTAVLRHYANSADLIKEKPEIMQLLLGQKAKNLHIDFSSKK